MCRPDCPNFRQVAAERKTYAFSCQLCQATTIFGAKWEQFGDFKNADYPNGVVPQNVLDEAHHHLTMSELTQEAIKHHAQGTNTYTVPRMPNAPLQIAAPPSENDMDTN